MTYMEETHLDVLLITDPKHVYYFTGFASNPHERFLGLVFRRDKEPFLLVPALDRQAAESAPASINVYAHQDTEDPYLLLQLHCAVPVRKLGIEKDTVTVRRMEQLQAALCPQEVIDIQPRITELRMIKTQEELSLITSSIELVEQVLQEGVKKVRIGAAELELVAELEYQMKKLGAQAPAFDTLVLTGKNSALPHGRPGPDRIQSGDLLLFDLGVYYNGYASDITRTFAIGEISPELQRIYEVVREANERAIRAVKPGAVMAAVDQSAREFITSEGFGPQFLHRLGHGLGLDVHEYPSVHGANQESLRAGMVLTIEPGIYVPGKGGVRIEDDVLVAPEGARVLTTFPKELACIG
ncbi:M24 family metallopeptidase [Paenibacillus senegalensis]|uniref:M24 family metallopeptidase n=1 Tax=Paenibacillus senegalensis TaxID=1465766 RepID=UPI0005A6D51B|nr:Xaa-Pro peptidase family protein [Paenibacillus senegalensis]